MDAESSHGYIEIHMSDIWAVYARTMSKRPMPHTNNKNVHLGRITKTNKRTREEEHENIRKRYNKYKIRRWDNKKIIAKRKENGQTRTLYERIVSGLWTYYERLDTQRRSARWCWGNSYERIMSGLCTCYERVAIPKEDRHVDVDGISKRPEKEKEEQIMSGLWADYE